MATTRSGSAVDPFYQSREWLLGDGAQKRWARFVASRGNIVLPTYAMSDEDSSRTKAPVLYAPDGGLLVAPDALVLRNGRGPRWHEVKAKGAPTWRWTQRRWEHGCDWSLVCEYRQVQRQTGSPVFIVVHEELTPEDPARESPLVPADFWLIIPLAKALVRGQRRPTWPGGCKRPRDRGRRGMGGLLWARDEMDRVRLEPVKPAERKPEPDDEPFPF